MTDLKVVRVEPSTALEHVERLEEQGGDLVKFCNRYMTGINPQIYLVNVERDIQTSPDAKQLMQRWLAAIEHGTSSRITYLQAQALAILEDWDNQTRDLAAANANAKLAFCKTMLNDVLVGRQEYSKCAAKHPFVKELRALGVTDEGEAAPIEGGPRTPLQQLADDLEDAS